MQDTTNEDIIKEVNDLEDKIKTLIISTTDNENNPLTNYSPFVKIDGDYFVSVSSHLPHYKNIAQNKKAHVMILEDEKDASHIYARKRVYFECECEIVEEKLDFIYEGFDKRFGESLAFIKQMSDFKIIKFIPKTKSIVLGFGAAYIMDKDGNIGNKSISHGK